MKAFNCVQMHIFIDFCHLRILAQWAEAVEFTDCFFAEG